MTTTNPEHVRSSGLAVRTRFHGPTDSSGSRVTASLLDRSIPGPKSVTTPWDYALSPLANHYVALRVLADRRAEFGIEQAHDAGMDMSDPDVWRGVWKTDVEWTCGSGGEADYVWIPNR